MRTAAEVAALITAIDEVKILDPACGSGAFPMGVLHKLVPKIGPFRALSFKVPPPEAERFFLDSLTLAMEVRVRSSRLSGPAAGS